MKNFDIYNHRLAQAFERLRDRHRTPINWLPFPAAIVFYLVLLLSVQILPEVNPRVGSPAQLFQYGHRESPQGALWFSLTPVGEQMVALTSERRVFRWPLATENLEELAEFREYLKHRSQTIKLQAGLAVDSSILQTLAIIAADETLSYYHLRPVIAVLAEAGFASYGLETIRAPL